MNARPEATQAALDAQLPAEFRSALQLAQAAVWDWQLSVDRFQVDEAWVRAFGVDVGGGPMAMRDSPFASGSQPSWNTSSVSTLPAPVFALRRLSAPTR